MDKKTVLDIVARLTKATESSSARLPVDVLNDYNDSKAVISELMVMNEALSNQVQFLQSSLNTLAKKSQAVISRWETPVWKNVEPTAVVINDMRNTLQDIKDSGLYKEDPVIQEPNEPKNMHPF